MGRISWASEDAVEEMGKIRQERDGTKGNQHKDAVIGNDPGEKTMEIYGFI